MKNVIVAMMCSIGLAGSLANADLGDCQKKALISAIEAEGGHVGNPDKSIDEIKTNASSAGVTTSITTTDAGTITVTATDNESASASEPVIFQFTAPNSCSAK